MQKKTTLFQNSFEKPYLEVMPKIIKETQDVARNCADLKIDSPKKSMLEAAGDNISFYAMRHTIEAKASYWAMSQLCQKAGIPFGFYLKLAQSEDSALTNLADDNLNTLIKKYNCPLLIRMYKDIIRAVLSSRYSPFDTDKVVYVNKRGGYTMGLIKAGMGAIGGVLGDQWKEFIYCESLKPDVLVAKGRKRTSSRGRSSNTSSEDNIISNGSTIAINDGQCMIIVENGKVVEICSEPGEFVYDASTEPSLFADGLNMQSVKNVFAQIGKRFTYGGDPGKDQRVYYFNTKEIIGNKYGTASPIQFRIVDQRIGLDVDIPIRCFGEYSYKITNPILFYTNVCSNVENEYLRSEIDGQLKSELLGALNVAFGVMSEKGVRYSALPAHAEEIGDQLNEVLSKKWRDLRGIEVISFGVSSVKASEEDEKYIRDLQALSNPNARASFLTGATGAAMQNAASNEGGAMMGFMGMGMAGMQGANMMNGINQQMGYPPQGGYPGGPQGYPPQGGNMMNAINQQMAYPPQGGYPSAPQGMAGAAPAAPAGWTCSCGQSGNTGKFCAGCGKPKEEPKAGWTCSCGHAGNTGKFCAECGKPQQAAAPEGWTCSCGTVNQGKFCANCGAKKPADAPLYKCDKCGWVPPDPKNPPKFCPECGDLFDEKDVQ